MARGIIKQWIPFFYAESDVASNPTPVVWVRGTIAPWQDDNPLRVRMDNSLIFLPDLSSKREVYTRVHPMAGNIPALNDTHTYFFFDPNTKELYRVRGEKDFTNTGNPKYIRWRGSKEESNFWDGVPYPLADANLVGKYESTVRKLSVLASILTNKGL